MTNIYLTRHGKTVWNLEKRLQGFGDSKLTEEGINQAKELSERIKDMDIDAIYASPIKRAYETANIIKGEKDIDLIVDDRLKEINFGEYEGSTEEELLKEGRGKEIAAIFGGQMNVKAPAGESLSDLYERVKEFLEEILIKQEGKSILIVTHGTTLRAIVTYFKKSKEFYDVILGQATLTKVVCSDNNFEFEYINDDSHIKEKSEKKGW